MEKIQETLYWRNFTEQILKTKTKMGQAKNNLRTKLMKINWITRNLKITIKIF